MQYTLDAEVVDRRDNKIGKLDRLVLDPRSGDVTHIVVHKGLVLTEDRVVSATRVQRATADRVELSITENEMEDLPRFEQDHFVPLGAEEGARHGVEGTPATLYPYWPPGVSAFGMPAGVLPYVVERTRNVPPEAVVIQQGAEVRAVDGEEIGEVEQVLTHGSNDQATHLVVDTGPMAGNRRLVPIDWVNRVDERAVRLAVGAALVKDRLRAYEG